MIELGHAELTIPPILCALGFVQAESSSAALGGRSPSHELDRLRSAVPMTGSVALL
jgi:hypothetical protein